MEKGPRKDPPELKRTESAQEVRRVLKSESNPGLTSEQIQERTLLLVKFNRRVTQSETILDLFVIAGDAMNEGFIYLPKRDFSKIEGSKTYLDLAGIGGRLSNTQIQIGYLVELFKLKFNQFQTKDKVFALLKVLYA